MKPEFSYADFQALEPTVYDYYGYDSEELYLSNLENRPEDITLNGWDLLPNGEYTWTAGVERPLDTVILNYRINSHGFRGDEMPDTERPRSIITLGGDVTFGIGMPANQIWPVLTGTSFGWRCYNLAQSGGSLDQMYRLLLAWLPKLKSQYVFCLEPEPAYKVITNNVLLRKCNSYSPKMPLRYETKEEWALYLDKTKRAMQSVCDQFGAKFVFIHKDILNASTFHEHFVSDLGRDLEHPGRIWHAYITYHMLQKAGFEWSDIDDYRTQHQ